MSLITLHGCMFEEKNHILVLFIQYVLFLLKYSLYSLYYRIPFHAFSLLIIEFYLPQWRLLTSPLFWRHIPTLGSRNGFRGVSGLIHARKIEKKINVRDILILLHVFVKLRKISLKSSCFSRLQNWVIMKFHYIGR